MDSSSYDFLSKSAHRRVRKLLARSYLSEGRAAEALKVTAGLLRDDPNDPEMLTVLGNLYWAAGCPVAAAKLYRAALAACPDFPAALRQLAQAGGPDAAAPGAEALDAGGCDEPDPLAPDALDRLLARLEQAAGIEDLRAAADFLDNPLPDAKDEPGGTELDTVRRLMPALVAQNIRQARAAGHVELADALQSLQINLTRQASGPWAEDLPPDSETEAMTTAGRAGSP